jgi:tripartite-type tricarboxylate transporter receptor subunit TctC
MAIAAPPNTPKEITMKLANAVTTALQSPDVRARIRGLQAEPLGSTPEQMAERIRQNVERWKPVVTVAKITVD